MFYSFFASEGNSATISLKTPMSMLSDNGLSLSNVMMRIGDLAWDLISRISGTDVYVAKRNDKPCYLGILYARFLSEGLDITSLSDR